MTDGHPDVLLYPSDTHDLYCDGGALACRLCLVSSTLLYLWQRRIYLLAIEMTEIFFFEYTLQNQSFPASDYYSITMPVLRTFVATASQAFIWLIAMDLLDKHSKKQFVIPVATFLLSELLIIVAVPYGPIHQWLLTTRCVRYSFVSWGYISFGRHARARKSS